MKPPPIAQILAWVRDYRSRDSFARAERSLLSALEELPQVVVRVRQRTLLDSHRNVHGLSVTRQRLAVAGAIALVVLVTSAFGLSHVYRARREIGLLLSQGASKSVVLAIHALETLFISVAGAAAGSAAGMAAVSSGIAVPRRALDGSAPRACRRAFRARSGSRGGGSCGGRCGRVARRRGDCRSGRRVGGSCAAAQDTGLNARR